MTNRIIIGTQWGDEGKGKVTDFYASDVTCVVRFQGGNNAGHTIVVGDQEYKLHLLPSGSIQGKHVVIGNGVVVDPRVLLSEIEDLKKRGIAPQLHISDRAHVIMPYHRILDGAEERMLGTRKIGTTGRGIGPCYTDKIARRGIRMGDLIDHQQLHQKLAQVLPVKQRVLDAFQTQETLQIDQILREYGQYGDALRDYVTDTSVYVNQLIKEGKNILFEGAQGSMLDIDFGTYPFTTSSHTIAGGACIGVGISPRDIHEIIGIVKAYTTRVGEGPLPTELIDETGERIAERGHEYGTTTGRKRRCGWLDLVVVGHACRLNGITHLAITKLDVLDGLDTLKICTGYDYKGETMTEFPASLGKLEQCTPIYETFPGWDSVRHIKKKEDLPREAQTYLTFISRHLDTPLSLVSTGPERQETIPY